MFEPIKRSADAIRFTPLWWVAAALGAGAIFFLDFVRVTWLGSLLCIASAAVLWYVLRRSKGVAN
jgi:hypothetical protein